jgi:hypothetical protein
VAWCAIFVVKLGFTGWPASRWAYLVSNDIRAPPHSTLTYTIRLNDDIFRAHLFSVVTPARVHKSDGVFRFYVYGGTFDNPPGRFYLNIYRTSLGTLNAYGFLIGIGTTTLLSASVFGLLVVRDGGILFRRIS